MSRIFMFYIEIGKCEKGLCDFPRSDKAFYVLVWGLHKLIQDALLIVTPSPVKRPISSAALRQQCRPIHGTLSGDKKAEDPVSLLREPRDRAPW